MDQCSKLINYREEEGLKFVFFVIANPLIDCDIGAGVLFIKLIVICSLCCINADSH